MTEAGFAATWTCLDASSNPIAKFDATPTTTCDGNVHFEDKSIAAPTSWLWKFGDGTTSTSQNPIKTYTASNTYDVSLKVCNANSCDSITKSAYITVNIGGTCEVLLPESGSGATQTTCTGLLKDDGGDEDYSDESAGSVTIAPPGATSVTLTFNSFGYEEDYDYLYIYDGPSTNSPLIGAYTGNNLPNGGIITSSGGSITILQLTDAFVKDEGFELTWTCAGVTGLEGNIDVNSIDIYPNPTDGIVNISMDYRGAEPVNIAIRDMLQTTVIETTVASENADHTSLDVSQLAAGVYFISIGNDAVVKKLIIE